MALGEADSMDPSIGSTESNAKKRKTITELRREQIKRQRQNGASSQRSDPPKAPELPGAGLQPPKPKFSLSKFKEPFGIDGASAVQPSSQIPTQFARKNVCQTIPKTFKSVKELSLSARAEPQKPTRSVDMEKAMKMFSVANRPAVRSMSAPVSQLRPATIDSGHLPLDLSLKSSARFTSSSSFHWCQRVGVEAKSQGLKHFICKKCAPERTDTTDEQEMELFWRGLHSWVHPQFPITAAFLNGLLRGGEDEKLVALQMQRGWEEAFQSLYFAFRNVGQETTCDIFYFCTNQFVVLFIGGGIGGRSKDARSAYLTRSTRRLRSLFQEQNIVFTMPHCKSKAAATAEELKDLIEFEKLNPGQTRIVDPMAGVDNTVQSLLAIDGNENVHRVYDFLLNYRHNLGGMICLPTLCSPVPFQNASLKIAEYSSKQMVTPDTQTVYSLDIKGALLPPWIISRLCLGIQNLQKEGFEVSFITEKLTEGLNVAQSQDEGQTSEAEPRDEVSELSEFGQRTDLGQSVIKQLKYTKLSNYVATI